MLYQIRHWCVVCCPASSVVLSTEDLRMETGVTQHEERTEEEALTAGAMRQGGWPLRPPRTHHVWAAHTHSKLKYLEDI